jgi:Dna[CI] antecedent, DciA
MHKKTPADKKTRSRSRAAKPSFGKVPSRIKDLLSRGSRLQELAARLPEQQSWVQWLRSLVSPELAAHIVNVVPKPLATEPSRTELLVLADSAAWCARLRYALAGLEAEISQRDAAVQRMRVGVTLS